MNSGLVPIANWWQHDRLPREHLPRTASYVILADTRAKRVSQSCFFDHTAVTEARTLLSHTLRSAAIFGALVPRTHPCGITRF